MFIKLKLPKRLNSLKFKLICFIKSKFTRERVVKAILLFLFFCLLLLVFKLFAPFFALYFKQLCRVLYGSEPAECGGMCSKGGNSSSLMEEYSPGSDSATGQASSTKRLRQMKTERPEDYDADRANAVNLAARNITAGGIAAVTYAGNEVKKGNVPNLAKAGKAAFLGVATYNSTDALKDEAFRKVDELFPTKSRRGFESNDSENSNR